MNRLPSQAAVARSYGTSKQGMNQLCQRHGFTMEQLHDPDFVLQKLLADGNCSKTRTRLTDPATREAIKQSLSTN
jgi:hypothetical protein